MKAFPEDLLYSREHMWVHVDGNIATIGITDYAQEKLGELSSIELPGPYNYVEIDEQFGTIETATAQVAELVSPVSGEIIRVNDDVADDISIINSDPHDAGWLIMVDMSDLQELEELLNSHEYQEYTAHEL